ncbi:hypothetical protein SAMN02745220_01669 [Desulfopila aestuarii DSM 18488]|uniref:Uncharacterized protein n=1 Tax=Desulfopila aestuarii DSM 18488 TaxID=1121416 RepID=A0A1M7Y3U7_9BACT|nr:hypothetical protein SAMN02745220_01669 [Desulfopila aestuarii DSM 18488]
MTGVQEFICISGQRHYCRGGLKNGAGINVFVIRHYINIQLQAA